MRRRALLLALSLVTLASAAWAETKEAGQYVDLSPVAMPVVSNGRLVNYVFVAVRVNLRSGADTPKLREREPYFRDALVRLGHRTPFTNPADLSSIDAPRLKAALFAAVQPLAPGQVASIEILSQTPKRHISTPKR